MRQIGRAVEPRVRDTRVDFCRGLALVFMFWDHIPDNVLGYLTPRNFGLSDAAEIFVFLAGFSAAVAYGRAFLNDGAVVAGLKVLRRAWSLYIAQIFVFALLTGVVVITNAHVETRDFVQEMGLGYFLTDTEQAVLAELTLRFKPNLMDPLPLYIALLIGFAAALPLVMRRPWWALGLSAMLYLSARHWNINFHARPDGVWFFNPFAWQFPFMIGAVAAVTGLGPHHPGLATRPVLRRALLALAVLVLLASAALRLSWNWPAWHDSVMPQVIADVLYPIDKTNLSPLRLFHFLALAWVFTIFYPDRARFALGPTRHIAVMGRHSLEIFCLSVLLAPLADAANALGGDVWAAQAISAAACAGLMIAVAHGLSWARRTLGERRAFKPPAGAVSPAE